MSANELILVTVREDGSLVVQRNLEKMGASATTASVGINTLKAALMSLVVGLAIREFAQLSDEATNINNRLHLVTSTTQQLNTVYGQLYEVSNQTRSGLEKNAMLFSNVALATKNLNLSYNDLLLVTKRVDEAVALSGASAQATRNGIYQLSEAFSVGTLQGQHLKALLTDLPGAGRAIADHMGVAVGQLRELGKQGKITSEVLIASFTDPNSGLDAQFAKLTPTISSAFTVLHNHMLNYLNDVSNASGLNEILANSILFIAEHFNALAGVVLGLALVIAGPLVEALITASIAFLTTPIGLFTAAVAIALGLLGEFGDKMVVVEGQTATIWEVVKAGFQTAWTVLSAGTSQIWDWFIQLIQLIGDWEVGVLQAVGDAYNFFADMFQNVYAIAHVFWLGLGAHASTYFTTVAQWLDNHVTGWRTDLSTIGGYVYEGVNFWIGLFVGLIQSLGPIVAEGIPLVFKLGIEQAKDIVVNGVEEIVAIFANGLGAIAGALDKLPGIHGVGDAVTNALTINLDQFKTSTLADRTALKGLGSDLSATFSAAQIDYIGEGTKALDKFGVSAQTAASGALNDAKGAVTNLSGSLNNLGGSVQTANTNIRTLFDTNLTDAIANAKASQTANALLADSLGGVSDAASGTSKAHGKLNDQLKLEQKLLQDTIDKQLEFNKTLVAASDLMNKDPNYTKTDALNALSSKMSDGSDKFANSLFSGTQEAINANIEQFAAMYLQIDAMRAKDIISERSANQAKMLIDEKYNEMRWKGASDTFTELAQLSSSHNRTIAAIGKAAAVTQATIDGILAVQKALASEPPPWNFAMAAAVGVVTAANIAQILSTNTNFATGGSFMVGGSGGVDSQMVSLRASPGERVTIQTPSQVQKGDNAATVGNGAGNGSPTVNARIINVLDPAIVGDYLSTDAGEVLVMNVIKNNSSKIKALMSNG